MLPEFFERDKNGFAEGYGTGYPVSNGVLY